MAKAVSVDPMVVIRQFISSRNRATLALHVVKARWELVHFYQQRNQVQGSYSQVFWPSARCRTPQPNVECSNWPTLTFQASMIKHPTAACKQHGRRHLGRIYCQTYLSGGVKLNWSLFPMKTFLKSSSDASLSKRLSIWEDRLIFLRPTEVLPCWGSSRFPYLRAEVGGFCFVRHESSWNSMKTRRAPLQINLQ